MKMLPCLCCTLVFTGTLLAQSPPDIAKPQTPVAGAVSVNSSNRIARAADGRRYIINEVKVTLRDEFAQKLQRTQMPVSLWITNRCGGCIPPLNRSKPAI